MSEFIGIGNLDAVPGENLKVEDRPPNQHQQYAIAFVLLKSMGIETRKEKTSSDSRTGKGRLRHSRDIQYGGSARSINLGRVRLYGVEGSILPLGFALISPLPHSVERIISRVAEAARSLSPLSRKATDKALSEGTAPSDGKRVSAVFTDYLSVFPSAQFAIGVDDQTGFVRIALPQERYETHQVHLGNDRIVGLEFHPVTEVGGVKSGKLHGDVAFLTLPEGYQLSAPLISPA